MLSAWGSPYVEQGLLELRAGSLPTQQFGYLLDRLQAHDGAPDADVALTGQPLMDSGVGASLFGADYADGVVVFVGQGGTATASRDDGASLEAMIQAAAAVFSARCTDPSLPV